MSKREVIKLSGRALHYAEHVHMATEGARVALEAMQLRHERERETFQAETYANIQNMVKAILGEVGMTSAADRLETLDLEYLEHTGDAFLTFHPEPEQTLQ
jgi:hypothetical protein